MALHDTAIAVRRGVVLFIIFLFVLLTGMASIDFIKQTYLRLNPPPEPGPTVAFGKLPKLNLPSLKVITGNPEYVIDTVDGKLPTFEDRVKVYKTVPPKPSILGSKKARDLAKRLGFKDEGTLTSQEVLVFTDVKDQKTLTINYVTNNFTLETPLKFIKDSLAKQSSPPETEAVEKAAKFLSSNGLLVNGFEEGNQQAQRYVIKNGTPQPVGEFEKESHFTKVDFFRNIKQEPKNLALLPSNPKIGLISVYLVYGVNVPPYISYTNWEQDLESWATYPLKPVSEAWEDVKSLQLAAYIRKIGESDLSPFSSVELKTIALKEVFIAYFDDKELNPYIQPIYVFKGVGFTEDEVEYEWWGYVGAVSEEWEE